MTYLTFWNRSRWYPQPAQLPNILKDVATCPLAFDSAITTLENCFEIPTACYIRQFLLTKPSDITTDCSMRTTPLAFDANWHRLE
ncbi:hypothetical protein PENPOL_c010G10013 [Penicillium polonicum]|uniref:Uncharacterized protein n=1 Tax=Penicillium polonicum TaxID=60169 RepID=A0A1V6NFM2_PENPO|nr:hypothetical protein PENPOL_c010G10013 [Penicillium polonicum]